MGTNNPTKPTQDKYKKDYNKTASQFDWDAFQNQTPAVDFLNPELVLIMLGSV